MSIYTIHQTKMDRKIKKEIAQNCKSLLWIYRSMRCPLDHSISVFFYVCRLIRLIKEKCFQTFIFSNPKLLEITCLHIAQKMVEDDVVELKCIFSCAKSRFKKRQVITMEKKILQCLDYQLPLQLHEEETRFCQLYYNQSLDN